MKTALITGITGQDGAYLARLLLDKGYKVIGAHRRGSSLALWRLGELGVEPSDIELVGFELLETTNIQRVLERTGPDEVYNLAAQTFVQESFEQPIFTSEVNALGAGRLLEAIRIVDPGIRFYQASTSEMYGRVQATPQDERTPFYPRSPYGVSKLFAHWLTVNYREAHNLFTCAGILFNHESPLRGQEFVTRKITHGLAALRVGATKAPLMLGNLHAKRDWGFAGDYVEGMWLMLQQEKPDDFVLATGVTATVRTFADLAANALGMALEWRGEGIGEHAVWEGRTVIKVHPQYYRPAEVDILVGDASKARTILGWEPKTNLQALVKMMADADLKRHEHYRAERAREDQAVALAL